MNVGFLFSFLSKFLGNCQTSSDHFITCSPFPKYTIFYGGREGGAEIPRSVRKFCPQKEGWEQWMLVCCSKPEMTFLERSISGQTRSDLKRDEMRCRYKL